MKKYISILSLITALFIQSCERSESDLNPTDQKQQNMKVQSNKESARIENGIAEEKGSDNMDTGDDDEPKKDKQHWRMVQDTIW
ncbi:hypothetical protein NAL32_02490 [Chryseobacterium sp. Ch-15]|uniref:Lipoprotein n=1 Tax=Chryseobacterium muglaense TaxID=2893752 RepID=A0A9Q3YSV0_9FLAO|nr:hypothetical protein [Chryseobacterium muglaense]MBD3903346.1 hypothetical protein [Chryseobacterium muglaense]MCC9036174.1 hypothetical protein [Chryseobacterium muglaense]MCM2553251.1 hypothetical protein [Chryseobacterium muglaense]